MQDFEDKNFAEDDKVEISDLDTPDERKNSSLIYRVLERVSEIRLSPRIFILALLIGGSVLAYQFIPFPHSKTTSSSSISYGSLQVVSTAIAPAINISVDNGIAYILTEDGTLNAKRASDGKLLWQSKVPISSSQPTTLPIIADNLIFLVSQNSQNGDVNALRAGDGTVQWSFQVPSFAFQSLLINDGVVYFLTQTGTIYALDESKGKPLWQFATGETTSQVPDVLYASNGITAVRTNKQIVYLLHAHDGSELWHYTTGPLDTPVSWYPDIEENTVYIHINNSLQARWLGDGQLLWQYIASNGSLWSYGTQNGVVYIYTWKNTSHGQDGSLKALGPDGSLLWQHNDISNWDAQQQGYVFVMQTNGSIEALQAQDGSLLWQFKPSTPGNIFWHSATMDGFLYIATNGPDKAIFALQASDGSLLWYHALNNPDANTPPYMIDGSLYVTQSDGSIDVWRCRDGSHLWHYQPSVAIAQGPIEVDGLVYMLQGDGSVHVLRAQDGKEVWSYSVS